MSEDAMTNPDKLMILIHGSGVVRAGQWARRYVISENLIKLFPVKYHFCKLIAVVIFIRSG